MLAGLIAAILTIAFAEVVGEPQVDRAIAFESAEAQQHGEAEEPELVSRDVQKTLGLATAVGLLAVAYGGLYAVAFALIYGRVEGLGTRTTALFVALATFCAIYLIPFLKYPANPPAVGNPDTIGRRTALYFAMMLISIAAVSGSVLLARRLSERTSRWTAWLLSLGALAVVVVVAYLLMPSINEVPEEFPAVVLWRFRIASLGAQLVCWAGIGLIFGALSERALHASTSRPRTAPAVSKPAAG
jgi:predicted cobalt transporter CbtA